MPGGTAGTTPQGGNPWDNGRLAQVGGGARDRDSGGRRRDDDEDTAGTGTDTADTGTETTDAGEVDLVAFCDAVIEAES